MINVRGDGMKPVICAKFEKASKLLSKRWIGLIINQLMGGSKRFSTLESEIQVSGKVLSERLKELENEDIITRTVYAEVPVRVEYALTKKGYALKPVMDAIDTWSQSWIKEA